MVGSGVEAKAGKEVRTLDGYVPLAYLLDDDAMKKKAQKWIDWTVGPRASEWDDRSCVK